VGHLLLAVGDLLEALEGGVQRLAVVVHDLHLIVHRDGS
jgi:hypothetical protein